MNSNTKNLREFSAMTLKSGRITSELLVIAADRLDLQAAEIERLREAITEYLEAQDAVDNNEYLFSPEKYGKLNLRRRAARDDLDAALSGETA